MDIWMKSFTNVARILIPVLLSTVVEGQVETKKIDLLEQYIVTSHNSAVMQGSERVGTAPLGAVVDVSHHRGPWRYSKQTDGWVHVQDLVLVEDALEEFTAQIKKKPSLDSYHLRGITYMALQDWGRAVNDLEEAYSLGESSVTLHLNLGTCFFNLKLFEKSLDEYSSIIVSNPEEVRAYVSRGDLFLDLGEHQLALKDFEMALELSPKSAEIHNSIGVTYRMIEKYPEAIESYSKCLELEPDFMPAFVNRGYAHKRTKRFKLALEDYEQALELVPTSASAKNDLAWLLATCEEEKFRDGKRSVELALFACRKVEYRNPEYLDTLAAAYARIGDFDKAVETVSTAIELFEDGAEQEDCEQRRKLYRKKKAFRDIVKIPEAKTTSSAETSPETEAGQSSSDEDSKE